MIKLALFVVTVVAVCDCFADDRGNDRRSAPADHGDKDRDSHVDNKQVGDHNHDDKDRDRHVDNKQVGDHNNHNFNDAQRANFKKEDQKRREWLRAHKGMNWKDQHSWTPQQRAEWQAQQAQWNQFDQQNPGWQQDSSDYNGWNQFSANGPSTDWASLVQQFTSG